MAQVNWFEGGRRITLLIQGIVILCCVVSAVFWNPSVRVAFETTGPTAPWTFKPDADICLYPSHAEYVDGDEQLTTYDLCYRAKDFDGEPLIAYRTFVDGTQYGGDYSEPEVAAYIRARTDSFRLTGELRATTLSYVNEQKSQQRLEHAIAMAVVCLGLLFAVWLLSRVTGWLVRGFAGIPRGSDQA